MSTELGRPRSARIDAAVLAATAEMIGETSYADLSLDAIARRAGTTKPAIYRRWPSKAHLVHEAVFPLTETTELPATGSLAADVREMLRRTAILFTNPAARSALPGLVGEMAADPTLHTALLERFSGILTDGMSQYLAAAAARGDVRPDVTARQLAEAIAGMTFVPLLARGGELDETWVEQTATLITRGISA